MNMFCRCSHDGCYDIQVIHLLDGKFPVFNFHGVLSVCEENHFACPCFLFGEVRILRLNTDDDRINSYPLKLNLTVMC